MAANTIKITTLGAAVVLVAIIEAGAPWLVQATGWPRLAALGFIRSLEIAAMLGVVGAFQKGLQAIGWTPRMWVKGLRIGALWSLGFGFVAALGMTAAFILGCDDPLKMIRTPMPGTWGGIAVLFLVGGLIGPIAEEICFRGLIYTFFRRWGVVIAMAASTLVFVALHSTNGLPVVQIIGGLVFAVTYEITGNLMASMVIHILGNCAIFALSLPWA